MNGTLNSLNGTTICDKSTGDCGPCKKGFFGEKCEKGIIFYLKNWYFVFKIVLTIYDKTLRKKNEVISKQLFQNN